jgi:hypothetical protein
MMTKRTAAVSRDSGCAFYDIRIDYPDASSIATATATVIPTMGA